MENVYSPFKHFMLRAPVYSLDKYKQYLSGLSDEKELENRLKHLLGDAVFREAILVSSPSLYKSVNNIYSDNYKKRSQIVRSLTRYLNRMSTRATPFGVFSGVVSGTYTKQSSRIEIENINMHQKRARVDMEWLLKLIYEVETDLESIKKMEVQTNQFIFENGTRVYLLHSNNSDNSNINNKSINLSKPVKFILNSAKEPIPFEKLGKLLKANYPSQDMKFLWGFLINLIKEEYLISSLRPPLLDVNPLEYVIKKTSQVRKLNDLTVKLKKIDEMIKEYNQTSIGEGLDIFESISEKMTELVSVKTPLQVDLSLGTSNIHLNEIIKKDLAIAAELLVTLSSKETMPVHLKDYMNDFIEKYGTNREVPLLELLDSNVGLGAPATYENPLSERRLNDSESNYTDPAKDFLLHNIVMEGIKTNKNEIVLSDEEVRELKNDISLDEMPDSMEIYASVISNSEKDIDEGNYQIEFGPAAGIARAGQTFGRFFDILDNDITLQFEEFYRNQAKCKDIIYAELVFVPSNGRVANVVLSKDLHGYQINLGSTCSDTSSNNISLHDLVVGYDAGRLYLKSLSLNKEVIPTITHMLNTRLPFPNVYRFLSELSQQNIQLAKGLSLGALNNNPYTPRIRYGKIILSPAKWRLTPMIFNLTKEVKQKEWISSFVKFKQTYDMPRFVYLTESDNRLLLDLENDYHLKELYRELNKLGEFESLLLEETFGVENSSQHNCEFVFPLKKVRENVQPRVSLSCSNVPLKETKYFPGSEWLFLKLYGCEYREEELIGFEINNFTYELLSKDYIKKSFYMRYRDPKKHIRLRLKIKDKNYLGNVFQEVYNWTKGLKNNGLISELVIDTYIPEIERYGGPKLIKEAENIFHYDSEVSYELIKLIRSRELKLDEDLIGVISIIDILEAMDLSFEEQLAFLNSYTSYKNHLKEFRKERNHFLKFGDSYNNWEGLIKTSEGQLIRRLLDIRKKPLSDFSCLLKKYKKELYNSKEQIIMSLIHLHINRLFGTDRDYEEKILTLARHTLHNLRYKRKNTIGIGGRN